MLPFDVKTLRDFEKISDKNKFLILHEAIRNQIKVLKVLIYGPLFVVFCKYFV